MALVLSTVLLALDVYACFNSMYTLNILLTRMCCLSNKQAKERNYSEK